jgi:hypothetical protein
LVRDVTAAFIGLTAPVREILDDIHRRNWTVTKVDIKDNQYVATAQNPYGEKIEKTGPTDNTALGNLLLAIMRKETIRYQARTSNWEAGWEDQLAEIAHAYAEAPVYDPKAAGAWKELADDMTRRAQLIQQQVQVELTPDPAPYKDVAEMAEDVRKNRHIYVSKANCTHPLWSVDQVLAYRLCRDVLGHCAAGGDWGWHGENRATSAMMPLLSPPAQQALFTESIGRAAYNAYYRSFGPHKITFLDKHLEDENPAGHAGIHPSQTIIPGMVPDLREASAGPRAEHPALPCPHCEQTGGVGIYEDGSAQCRNCGKVWHVGGDAPLGQMFDVEDFQSPGGLEPEPMSGQLGPVRQGSAPVTDPNGAWESGVQPLPDNAYLWQRETNGLDPLDWQGLKDAAEKLDTGWHRATHPDGQPDLETQRQAVLNSLRAVLLAPRKNLRWNATHYQHMYHLPGTVSDPVRYWDALEMHRDHHNMARGLSQESHRREYAEGLEMFKGWIKSLHPELHDAEVGEKARRELFHMLAEEEERILQEDPDAALSANEVEIQASREIARRLKTLTKPNVDKKMDFGDSELYRRSNLMGEPDPGIYGSFLVHHIRPIAALGHHANDLLRAARNDVANNEGRGHHWRKEVLSLGIPGVGPKEASFAWLLLQPKTSQLALMNPDVAEILGHKPEDCNDRDYFKHERELAAGRDAAGYTHVPLGQFSWGMWDYRHKPGFHSDLTPLRAVDPHPHDQFDWANYEIPPVGSWHKPYWWDSTKDAREQTADEFDKSLGVQFPAHEVPYQRMSKLAYLGMGPIESFEHWWTQEEPIGPWKVKKMADYAVGEKLTEKELKSFLEKRKDDVIDFPRFKKELLAKVKDVYPGLRQSALGDPAPWYTRPDDGESDVGAPGESIMQFVKLNHPELSTEQIWELVEEAGKHS